MKIFITGNLGFIGAHLSELLIDNGHTIVGFDKRQSSEKEKYKCIQGNILDSELLNLSISNDIDLIIHLAAEHKDNVRPESLYYDVNVRGTKNIIDACEINNINRIIFTSTIALYGLDLTDSNRNQEYSHYFSWKSKQLSPRLPESIEPLQLDNQRAFL